TGSSQVDVLASSRARRRGGGAARGSGQNPVAAFELFGELQRVRCAGPVRCPRWKAPLPQHGCGARAAAAASEVGSTMLVSELRSELAAVARRGHVGEAVLQE